MNKPKTLDNTAVARFLEGYFCAADLCEDHERIDDIFSGVLALRTEGVNSTRTLSRQVLFSILQQCETINVESVGRVTSGAYAYRTEAAYAAIARVASLALGRFVRKFEAHAGSSSVAQERRDIDAAYPVPAGYRPDEIPAPRSNLQPNRDGEAETHPTPAGSNLQPK